MRVSAHSCFLVFFAVLFALTSLPLSPSLLPLFELSLYKYDSHFRKKKKCCESFTWNVSQLPACCSVCVCVCVCFTLSPSRVDRKKTHPQTIALSSGTFWFVSVAVNTRIHTHEIYTINDTR